MISMAFHRIRSKDVRRIGSRPVAFVSSTTCSDRKKEQIEHDKHMRKVFLQIFYDIIGSIREPLVVLDADLKVVNANPSFYHTFNVKPEQTEKVLIYDLGNRQWDIPKSLNLVF